MAGVYRLTFNKPAVAQLLQTDSGETADGLKVRIENGAAQFLPVLGSKDGDVLELESRSRGGLEAALEGTMAEDLAKALTNEDGPFHTMTRVGGGWLGVKPHGSPEAPSKFIAHVRVWQNGPKTAKPKAKSASKPRAAKASAAASNSIPVSGTNVAGLFDYLRQAKSTVDDYSSSPKRGQPPREIREARQALAAFQQMAIDFLPEVSEAHAILHNVIARSGGNVEARPTRKAPTRAAKADAEAPQTSEATGEKSETAKALPRRARKTASAAKRRTSVKSKGGRKAAPAGEAQATA